MATQPGIIWADEYTGPVYRYRLLNRPVSIGSTCPRGGVVLDDLNPAPPGNREIAYARQLTAGEMAAFEMVATTPAQPRGEEDAVAECTCKFDADPNDPTEDTPETSWHYRRVCEHCKGPWYGLHCPHDGVQNPCPHCGVVPSVEETK